MTFSTDTTIQPGWTVWSADGEELGTVVALDADVIHVKKRGFLGGRVDVPRDAVDEVETGRVEISLTKDELTTT